MCLTHVKSCMHITLLSFLICSKEPTLVVVVISQYYALDPHPHPPHPTQKKWYLLLKLLYMYTL